MKRRNFIKFGAVATIAPIVSSAKTTHEDKIERNKAAMKRFETAINTADEALLNELVDPEAPFVTPVSKDSLYGGSGYNAIVKMIVQASPMCSGRCRTWSRTRDAWRCIGFAAALTSMILWASRLRGENLARG